MEFNIQMKNNTCMFIQNQLVFPKEKSNSNQTKTIKIKIVELFGIIHHR